MSMLPLVQKVTYWTILSVDGNGDPTYSPGVAISSRWVEKDGIVTDENGNDHKTEFVIYSDILIPKRSLAVLEDQDAVALPTKGARKVFSNTNNPSMSSLKKHVA